MVHCLVSLIGLPFSGIILLSLPLSVHDRSYESTTVEHEELHQYTSYWIAQTCADWQPNHAVAIDIRFIILYSYAPIIVKPHLPQVGQGWGLLGICKSRLTNSPLLGTILCCKSPTFCIGIPKTMKILGQMPQPWGQIMLTNRYKSPPIARPGVGGDWQW